MEEGKYYFDDGTECNPDLYSKPNLCLTCKKDDDPHLEFISDIEDHSTGKNNLQKLCHRIEDKERA